MENVKLKLAKEYVDKTSANIFLTGRAGTGKTTFLKDIVANSPKRVVVVAPTGVAAINASGVTIHSFFQLPFGLCLPEYQRVDSFNKGGHLKFSKTKLRIIRSMELLIIDEISMLRADMLDEVDSILRRLRRFERPFGGVQVLMIGDMQQLPPVLKDYEWNIMKNHYDSPYFFDAKVLRNYPYVSIELDHIYRQRDPKFIDILEAVRDNKVDDSILNCINERCVPLENNDDGSIILTTHNRISNSINNRRLEELDSPKYEFQARIENNFPENQYPQDPLLVLKKGAQVMFTKNDSDPLKRYVNGTLATVIDIDDDIIEVQTVDGLILEVELAFWENLKYTIDENTKEIVSHIDGLFYQYPLRLAWAITIHKSQGLTFDKVIIDARESFSHGQVYVALSRCKTLEGITLRTKIASSSIITDSLIKGFSRNVSQSVISEKQLDNDKRSYFLSQLLDLFDLSHLMKSYYNFKRLAEASAINLYPKAVKEFSEAKEVLNSEIFIVSENFAKSLNKLVKEDYLNNEYLQERVRKACVYFRDKALARLLPLVESVSGFSFDAKDISKIYSSYYDNLAEEVALKVRLWSFVENGFNLEEYLSKKAEVFLEITSNSGSTRKSKSISNPTSAKVESSDDIDDPIYLDKLVTWRREKSKELNIPAYCITHQRTLISISNIKPQSLDELLKVKGVGKLFVEKYGDEVMKLSSDL